jgi:hypothetical protein
VDTAIVSKSSSEALLAARRRIELLEAELIDRELQAIEVLDRLAEMRFQVADARRAAASREQQLESDAAQLRAVVEQLLAEGDAESSVCTEDFSTPRARRCLDNGTSPAAFSNESPRRWPASPYTPAKATSLRDTILNGLCEIGWEAPS